MVTPYDEDSGDVASFSRHLTCSEGISVGTKSTSFLTLPNLLDMDAGPDLVNKDFSVIGRSP